MTKKHFEAAAAIVKERFARARPDEIMEAFAVKEAFAELFAQFNPRFDKEKFYAACGDE